MSICPRGTTRLPQDGFSWNFIFLLIFSKICWENSMFIKIRKEWRVLYLKPFSYLWQYLAKFFFEWEICQVKVVEKIEIHIVCSVTFPRKSCRLWDNVEKYGGARGRKWQYGGALHAGLVRLHTRKYTPAFCIHARTYAHKHRNM
jgi:hypothetical protein